MKKLILAVAMLAALAVDASAGIRSRTVIVNRGPVFRSNRVVRVNNFGFHQPVRTFFVAPQPVFINQGFGTFNTFGGVHGTFAVPVTPFGFQTFQTFGCH